MGPGGPAGLFAQIAQYDNVLLIASYTTDKVLAEASAEVLVFMGGKDRTRALTMSI